MDDENFEDLYVGMKAFTFDGIGTITQINDDEVIIDGKGYDRSEVTPLAN